jgi:hypothetical protein
MLNSVVPTSGWPSARSIAVMIGSADRAFRGFNRPDRVLANDNLLRKACAEGRLEHLRVVNMLWLAPAAVESFALSWRAHKRER